MKSLVEFEVKTTIARAEIADLRAEMEALTAATLRAEAAIERLLRAKAEAGIEPCTDPDPGDAKK